MKAQEIFNKVRTHLLIQNKQARVIDSGFGNCKYRTNDGLKCAVGCLIPDDKYDPRFESMSLLSICRKLQFLLPEDLNEERGHMFLLELQIIHDNIKTDQWECKLKEFAAEHNLKIEEEAI